MHTLSLIRDLDAGIRKDSFVEWAYPGGKARGKVTQLVVNGDRVPDIAVDIIGYKHDPAARIEVYRQEGDRWIATGVFVGQQVKNLSRIEPLPDQEDATEIAASDEVTETDGDRTTVPEKAIAIDWVMGAPTADQLELINKHIPRGQPRLTAGDVVTIPFVAADNLINRGLDKWDVSSLKTMAALLPGIPKLLDHDWGDVSKVWGRIYKAEVVSSRQAPDEAIARAGNETLNRAIVVKEGFHQVVYHAFAAVNSPVVDGLRYGRLGEVSTGGFQFKDYLCPTCDTSFMNPKCPHGIPDKAWGMTADTDPNIAPYAIRTGLFDMGEVSLVTIPNLPNVGVIH